MKKTPLKRSNHRNSNYYLRLLLPGYTLLAIILTFLSIMGYVFRCSPKRFSQYEPIPNAS